MNKLSILLKSKTLLLSLFLVIIFVVNTNAQSRTNRTLLEFKTKSKKLTSAIGWEKNTQTGKWIENKNVISENIPSSSWISHIPQNFKWLQIAKVTKNENDYYIFIYEKKAGIYRYPSIQEGWVSDKRTYFFILHSYQYRDIKAQIEMKTGENIEITSGMRGYISDMFTTLGGADAYSEENLLAKITDVIETPSSYEHCFIMNSQTTDGIDILRFRLPEPCYRAAKKIELKYFEINISKFQTILID